MAVRYKSEFKSVDGTQWKIEIIDTTYSGAVSDFRGSFVLNYQSSEEDNLHAPLLSSDVLINAVSEDGAFDMLINDMFEAGEDRFFVKIYKGVALYWCGVLIADVSGMADAYYPQAVSLRAVDGLSFLKSVEFNSDDNNSLEDIGRDTLVNVVYVILDKLRTVVAGLWGASEAFFSENVNWYDVNHSATNVSVLANSRVYYEAFTDYDDRGRIDYRSCYEVLGELMTTFGCRLALVDGVWCMRQVSAWSGASSVVYRFDKSKVALSNGEAVNRVTNAVRLATQQFSFLPALRSVSQVFRHNGTFNRLVGVSLTDTSGNQVLGVDVPRYNRGRFLFRGVIRTEWSNNIGGSTVFDVEISVRLKVGSHYLERSVSGHADNDDYSGLSWVSSSDTVDYITEQQNIPGTPVASGYYDIAFEYETPVFESVGGVEVELIKNGVRDSSGVPFTPVFDVTCEMVSPILLFLNDDDDDNTTHYRIVNDNSNSLSKELVIDEEMSVGSLVSLDSISTMEVYNGSAWVNATDWKVGGSGTGLGLASRKITEIMAVRRKNVLRREGVFKGDLSLLDVIQLQHSVGGGTETRYFVAMRASLTAALDEWSGVWWNVRTDRSGLSAPVLEDFYPDTPPPLSA
ncbi:MAG: hypothetical protein ACPGFK_00670 [Flavobacteriaceae bacterium]